MGRCGVYPGLFTCKLLVMSYGYRYHNNNNIITMSVWDIAHMQFANYYFHHDNILMYTCVLIFQSFLSLQYAALERTPGDGADYSHTCHHPLSPLASDFSECEGAQYSSLDLNKVPLHVVEVDCIAVIQGILTHIINGISIHTM